MAAKQVSEITKIPCPKCSAIIHKNWFKCPNCGRINWKNYLTEFIAGIILIFLALLINEFDEALAKLLGFIGVIIFGHAAYHFITTAGYSKKAEEERLKKLRASKEEKFPIIIAVIFWIIILIIILIMWKTGAWD